MNQEPANQTASHGDVFVSYASQDVTIADAIVATLEKNGIKCWIAPRNVTPGSQYADEIVGAINDAKIVVLVLSEHAVASPHVGREIERAASKRRRVIAVRTDAAALTRSFEYFLSESQWIDVVALGMTGALTKLTQAASRALAAPLGKNASVTAGIIAAGASTSHRPVGVRGVVLGAGVVVALGMAIALGIRFWPSKHLEAQAPAVAVTTDPGVIATPGVAIPDKSIAVLPFADMSEKKDQEYFSDGLSEELIDLLAKVPGLRVTARTSSFYFKGKSEDIPTIAHRLMVAHVLDGSVRRSGKHLRITAQLIRADNGYHLWSESYDRQLDDLFKVQDEIASSVVRALVGPLNKDLSTQASVPLVSAVGSLPVNGRTDTVAPGNLGVSPIAGHGLTQNSEAYTFYLLGRSSFQRGTKDKPKAGNVDYETAVDYLNKALQLDPLFAAAWAEVAKTRVRQVMSGAFPVHQASKEARHSAERALALDPHLPAAYLSIGSVDWLFDWNWTAAEAEFRKAIELEPGNADAFRWAARAAITLGHFDEALTLSTKAIELDPLEVLNYKQIGDIYFRTGRYAQAQTAWRTGRALNPAYVEDEPRTLALVLLAQSDSAPALEALKRVPRRNWGNWYQAVAYHALGRKEESDAALARFVHLQAGDSPVEIAEIYACRKEISDALMWLDRAYERHDVGLALIKGDPFLRNLERDPRYKAFLKKMNLPE